MELKTAKCATNGIIHTYSRYSQYTGCQQAKQGDDAHHIAELGDTQFAYTILFIAHLIFILTIRNSESTKTRKVADNFESV